MSDEPKPLEPENDLQPEIAHLLLIDIVGYSKLLVNEQIELVQQLNQVVRTTGSFRAAEEEGKLIRLPTGDGMALLFFKSPQEPAQCALEICQASSGMLNMQLRMGVHSGPINRLSDVNDRSNVAGAGINIAQRVMDCGDAGHILLSRHLANDLAQYRHWRPYLHDLGECEVKHGLRLHIVNLFKNGLGNPAIPVKLRPGKKRNQVPRMVSSSEGLRRSNFAIGFALLLSAIAVAFGFWVFFNRPAPTNIVDKSIAVLPFEDLSDETRNTFLAKGVQDEILNDLAKVADLKVISRTSVMQYKGDGTGNLREIGKALGVAHIVEGTVQRVGTRVRVSAQLIDARRDAHLWAEHYDRDIADVFVIETEVAKEIVSQLKARLSPAEKAAIEERPTRDLVAYEFYLRAKDLVGSAVYARGKENRLEAVHLLDDALARDPGFFRAFCLLASIHDQIYLLGMDHTQTRLSLAGAAVRSAEHLRPEAGETHIARGEHMYCGYLDYDQAQRELALAVRVLPNEPRVFELTGYMARRQGHWDESIQNLKRALELDPRNFYVLQQIALSYEYVRRFSEEAAVLDKALLIVPTDAGARLRRAAIELDWHADTKPMHSVIQRMIAEDPNAASSLADQSIALALYERDWSAAHSALTVMKNEGSEAAGFHFPKAWCEGIIARAQGDHDKARAAFVSARSDVEKVVRGQPDYAQPLSMLGLIDAGLGRKEDAIREGRRAIDLMPVSKDALSGTLLIENLALIYAWTDERGPACDQLDVVVKNPSDLSYGQLRLHPFWDPLRGDPRFEAIVASLAPK